MREKTRQKLKSEKTRFWLKIMFKNFISDHFSSPIDSKTMCRVFNNGNKSDKMVSFFKIISKIHSIQSFLRGLHTWWCGSFLFPFSHLFCLFFVCNWINDPKSPHHTVFLDEASHDAVEVISSLAPFLFVCNCTNIMFSAHTYWLASKGEYLTTSWWSCTQCFPSLPFYWRILMKTILFSGFKYP